MMKIISSTLLISIIVFSRCAILLSQADHRMIEIKYFNFSMTTDSKIECSDFESAENFKTIQISDSAIIANFIQLTKKLKRDSIDAYMPDVRAKITLLNGDREGDVVCLSNFGICINNKPKLYSEEYVNYIKSIIKSKDQEFDY